MSQAIAFRQRQTLTAIGFPDMRNNVFTKSYVSVRVIREKSPEKFLQTSPRATGSTTSCSNLTGRPNLQDFLTNPDYPDYPDGSNRIRLFSTKARQGRQGASLAFTTSCRLRLSSFGRPAVHPPLQHAASPRLIALDRPQDVLVELQRVGHRSGFPSPSRSGCDRRRGGRIARRGRCRRDEGRRRQG